MAGLIDRQRRAKARADSAERKRRLLEVARQMLVQLPVEQVSLEALCKRADVTSGMASMYFGGRDELVLLLLREELASWYAWLEQRLENADGEAQRERLLDDITDDLVSRELLVRLVAHSWALLEGPMDTSEVLSFAHWQGDRSAAVGAMLEGRFRKLASGSGARLLLRLQLMMAAWVPAAMPRGPLSIVIGGGDLAGVSVDLRREIRMFLAGAAGDGE